MLQAHLQLILREIAFLLGECELNKLASGNTKGLLESHSLRYTESTKCYLFLLCRQKLCSKKLINYSTRNSLFGVKNNPKNILESHSALLNRLQNPPKGMLQEHFQLILIAFLIVKNIIGKMESHSKSKILVGLIFVVLIK